MKGKLDTALGLYYAKFGSDYPLLVVDLRSDDEIVKEIEECISKNKEAEPPMYEEGCVY